MSSLRETLHGSEEKKKKLHFRESAISVAFYGNYYIFLLYFIAYLDSMINLLFIIGIIRNIMSPVDITFKKYLEEVKIAIKTSPNNIT